MEEGEGQWEQSEPPFSHTIAILEHYGIAENIHFGTKTRFSYVMRFERAIQTLRISVTSSDKWKGQGVFHRVVLKAAIAMITQ